MVNFLFEFKIGSQMLISEEQLSSDVCRRKC